MAPITGRQHRSDPGALGCHRLVSPSSRRRRSVTLHAQQVTADLAASGTNHALPLELTERAVVEFDDRLLVGSMGHAITAEV
jgi:hypothetical protein